MNNRRVSANVWPSQLFALGTLIGLSCIAVFALTPPSQGTPHTVYYLQGRIYTNDPQHPWAEALAVQDGIVSCIGTTSHVLQECGGNAAHAETVQLQEKFVMPGFNDAHVHLGSAGADLLAVRLNGAQTVAELERRLADSVSQHKPGEWITGFGWDHTLWPDKKFPNRRQLDEVAPQNPVFFQHVSGHVAVANSLALKAAGITKSTPNPTGGEIERDSNGEPTGMLKEGAAMDLVRSKIPPLTRERRRQGIELALADVAKNGVTSLQDNSAWEDFQVYQDLKRDAKLTARITEWLPFAAPIERLEAMRREGGTSDPWL